MHSQRLCMIRIYVDNLYIKEFVLTMERGLFSQIMWKYILKHLLCHCQARKVEATMFFCICNQHNKTLVKGWERGQWWQKRRNKETTHTRTSQAEGSVTLDSHTESWVKGNMVRRHAANQMGKSPLPIVPVNICIFRVSPEVAIPYKSRYHSIMHLSSTQLSKTVVLLPFKTLCGEYTVINLSFLLWNY